MATSSDLPGFLAKLADEDCVPQPDVETDRRADDGALAVLSRLSDDSVRAYRVQQRARGAQPRRTVAERDYATALELAEGELALFSWSSGGVDIYGYRGHLVDGRPFDVWRWDEIANIHGEPPVTVDCLARETLCDELANTDPTIVVRERTAMPPLAECEHHDGGDR